MDRKNYRMTHYDYLADRKEGFINRWHAWPTIRNETLAEHNFFVVRNCLYIAKLLSHYNIANVSLITLLEMALEHDATEKILGDISGPAKRQYPDLKYALTGVEDEVIQDELYNNIPLGTFRNFYIRTAELLFDKELIETQIIKYVDVLDAYLFILNDLNMGNKNMRVHLLRVNSWLGELNWPWLIKLREQADLP